jgi:transcriptional regulator with XRE-family HTH domain
MRVSAGISQEALAKKLETKQSFISKYERGERTLNFIEVVKICNACEHPPQDLIDTLKL